MSTGDYEDLVSMDDLNESSMLANIQRRYERDCIYTWIGSVLVSVNPWRPTSGPSLVNTLASKAYQKMLRDRGHQAILVSGESGAGKSESCKMILNYLAFMSGGDVGGEIERKLLEASPILEAFGNAQTVRNNNSSRFGKFIKVHFDLRGRMQYAKVEHYLLEKARVVTQAVGERNFGIFYMLLEGSNAEEKKLLFPLPSSTFNYLSSPAIDQKDKEADTSLFMRLKKAMLALGLGSNEMMEIFGVLSGILYLGNIQFAAATSGGTTIVDRKPLEAAAKLLGIQEDALTNMLTIRSVTAGNRSSTSFKKLTPESAAQSRDAFAKALYGTLFDWIVQFLNVKLSAQSKEDSEELLTIGILDIFGFEIFEKNGFGQLLINYANETLQNLFAQQLFISEQQEYAKEKIQWNEVSFTNNSDCLDLISKKGTGILSLLEEECMLPHGSDAQLLQKMHTSLPKSEFYIKPKLDPVSFGVRHFAGDVLYELTGFVRANKDELHLDIAESTKRSTNQLVSFLATKMQAYSNRTSGTTVTGHFRQALALLLRDISQTSTHWIRCIRPSKEKQNRNFDAAFVLHQMRCVGMLATVKIRRAGYSLRIPFLQFCEKYKLVMGPYAANALTNPQQAAEQFLRHISPNGQVWVMGLTKVFLRDKLVDSLEQARFKREEELRRREEEERKRKAEEERKKREEEERKRKAEEERKRKEEEERKRKEEEDRRRKEEEERRRKEEEEVRKRKQEEERKRQEEDIRRKEDEKKRREEELRIQERARQEEAFRQEEDRKRKEQEELRRREEDKRKQDELQKKKQQEEGRKLAEQERKKKEEEERKRQEEERRKRNVEGLSNKSATGSGDYLEKKKEERVRWLEEEKKRREAAMDQKKRTITKVHAKTEGTVRSSPQPQGLSSKSVTRYSDGASLEDMLKGADFFANFAEFLNEIDNGNIIECWMELQNYKKLQEGFFTSYARQIFFKYFTSDVRQELGLDDQMVREVLLKMKTADATTFDIVERQILYYMETQLLPKFRAVNKGSGQDEAASSKSPRLTTTLSSPNLHIYARPKTPKFVAAKPTNIPPSWVTIKQKHPASLLPSATSVSAPASPATSSYASPATSSYASPATSAFHSPATSSFPSPQSSPAASALPSTTVPTSITKSIPYATTRPNNKAVIGNRTPLSRGNSLDSNSGVNVVYSNTSNGFLRGAKGEKAFVPGTVESSKRVYVT